MLRVYEIFRSIQGEGTMMGVPTAFVRLEGCNLRCRWCDTKFAYEGGREMEIEDIVSTVDKFGLMEVCITGGEPLMQDVMPLVQTLLSKGYHILLETNGSISISDYLLDGVMISMDWKVPSSGESDGMLLDNLVHLRPTDQIKFVVENPDDLAYIAKFLNDVDIKAPAVVQPVGGLNLEWLVDAVLTNGMNVRVMPQLHKFIWGEERGV